MSQFMVPALEDRHKGARPFAWESGGG